MLHRSRHESNTIENLTGELADDMMELGRRLRSYLCKGWMCALYLALGVSLLLSGCQAFSGGDDNAVRRGEVSELTLTQTDGGKSFEVHRDDVIVIHLEENPTTGYQWAVDKVDDKILALQSSEFLLPEEPKFGEGGRRILTFKAKTAGTTPIQLKHWREWEGDASIIERFDVTIVVKD